MRSHDPCIQQVNNYSRQQYNSKLVNVTLLIHSWAIFTSLLHADHSHSNVEQPHLITSCDYSLPTHHTSSCVNTMLIFYTSERGKLQSITIYYTIAIKWLAPQVSTKGDVMLQSCQLLHTVSHDHHQPHPLLLQH